MTRKNLIFWVFSGLLILNLVAMEDTAPGESPSWSNLQIGNTIPFKDFSLRLMSLSLSPHTPVMKKPAPDGRHYVLMTLKVTQVAKDVEVDSKGFIVATRSGEKFGAPGIWGKVEVLGKLNDFEAEQASQLIRKDGQEFNFIFTVPAGILPQHLKLSYGTD
jgi:hypothetical protein